MAIVFTLSGRDCGSYHLVLSWLRDVIPCTFTLVLLFGMLLPASIPTWMSKHIKVWNVGHPAQAAQRSLQSVWHFAACINKSLNVKETSGWTCAAAQRGPKGQLSKCWWPEYALCPWAENHTTHDSLQCISPSTLLRGFKPIAAFPSHRNHHIEILATSLFSFYLHNDSTWLTLYGAVWVWVFRGHIFWGIFKREWNTWIWIMCFICQGPRLFV